MEQQLSRIKLLAMDVDGTLTDGSMIVANGEQVKVFNVYDGLGIRLAMNYGLKIAWITGNVSAAVEERARAIGVVDVYQNAWVKSIALDDLAGRHGLALEEIAFIGDDLNDLAAFGHAGFCFAVQNASSEVKERADMVTERAGGHGAVREAIETILKARGEWKNAIASFLAALEKQAAGKEGPEAVA